MMGKEAVSEKANDQIKIKTDNKRHVRRHLTCRSKTESVKQLKIENKKKSENQEVEKKHTQAVIMQKCAGL